MSSETLEDHMIRLRRLAVAAFSAVTARRPLGDLPPIAIRRSSEVSSETLEDHMIRLRRLALAAFAASSLLGDLPPICSSGSEREQVVRSIP